MNGGDQAPDGGGGGDPGEGRELAPPIGICVDCGMPVSEGTCRVFYEVPLCPTCFHDMGLMRLALEPADAEDALVARILTEGCGPLSPTQRRRLQGLEKFAGLLPADLGPELLLAAASAGAAMDVAGLVRAALSARAVARHGRGAIKADGGSVNVLLYLASLVAFEITIAAMVRSGAVKRGSMSEVGEWEYEYVEPVGPEAARGGGPGPQGAFAPFAGDLRRSASALLSDLEGIPGVRAEDVRALSARLLELLPPE